MPRFLDTRGETKLAIGICARCSLKFPYSQLRSDPNYPGLYVCEDDLDNFDPYRLPARATEDITLDHPRPDVAIDGYGPSPMLQADPIVVVIGTPQVIITETSDDIITEVGGEDIVTEG